MKVALLGGGVVGSQVASLLQAGTADFAARSGEQLELVGVAVRDTSKDRPGIPAELLTDDAAGLVSRGDLDIVVEVMGGIEPARELILSAIKNGASVVTANKALMATHGAELTEAADHAGVDYMLTKMDEQNASYDEVLAEAQRLGYAEADPTADVGGADSAAKAAIIATLAFHTNVTIDDVFCEGITEVTKEDIAAAREMGFVIKLLAVAEMTEDEAGVVVRVHPAMVPRTHPLASVRDAFNAVFVEAESAGEMMFYGRGAGGAPTASAVLGDLVAAARNRFGRTRSHRPEPYAAIGPRPIGEARTRYAVAIEVQDRPGVLAAIATTFADNGVSIKAVRQDGVNDGARLNVRTHVATEANLSDTVEALRVLDGVNRVAGVTRVEGVTAP